MVNNPSTILGLIYIIKNIITENNIIENNSFLRHEEAMLKIWWKLV